VRPLHLGVTFAVACLAAIPWWGPSLAQAGPRDGEYRRRVDAVLRVPGLAAFWDFVKRDGASGRFDAHQTRPGHAASDYTLEVVNYVREYWNEGRPAVPGDVPTLGSGPFGGAIGVRAESDPTLRPLLLIPRARLHDTPIDVKGPGASVSMVAWVVRESGNHAVAGIWHEGTDLEQAGRPQRVERGMRQYALFTGLAANAGGSAVHVSENGAASFGDRYARNLATTPEIMPAWRLGPTGPPPEARWSVMGFTFDNDRDIVMAYLDGVATSLWIERPETHPFFQWPARGWQQAELARQRGVQAGEDATFPRGQWYSPPEETPRTRTVIEQRPDTRVELHEYAFTRVRVTYAMAPDGTPGGVMRRDLVALSANPYWFGHDLYAPATAAEGGPFTIGRVIHSSRSVGFTGAIGGVAVYRRALRPEEMRRLSRVAARGPIRVAAPSDRR
jgi:hypothetical protein